MKCRWQTDGIHAATGWPMYQCAACGNRVPSPYLPELIEATCGRGTGPDVPPEIAVAVATAAESRGMLLGDMVKALTDAIGIPTCGGCDKRREWLNKAHAWLRS